MNTTEPFERSNSSMVAFSSAARSPAGVMARGSTSTGGSARCSSHGRPCHTSTPPISAATSSQKALTRKSYLYHRTKPMRDSVDLALGLAVLAAALFASGHAVIYKRESRSAALWVVLIWVMPALGPILYLLMGVNRVQRRAARLRADM